MRFLRQAVFFVFSAAFVVSSVPAVHAQTWDVLSDSEKATLNSILSKWEAWVPKLKADGFAPLMTFKELYSGMTEEELAFLERVRKIDPRKSFGFQGEFLGSRVPEDGFVQVKDQWILKDGKPQKLDAQYLPKHVYEAYTAMMEAMQNDIGKKLLIESGYRSPACQLYTFLFYTPKHHYSLSETGKWVALPGYSEHGAPQQQAIDFINVMGINGEDHPEEFEALPEYRWLLDNAARFGFVLSYPRNQPGITFEPWHWSRRPAKQEAASPPKPAA